MTRQSLLFDLWPAIDRALWQQAQAAGDFFEEDGKAAHWRAATTRQVAKGYALWLGFLAQSGASLDVPPEARINPASLRAYVTELKQRDLASTTIASRITDLYEAIRVMVPEADRSLLRQAKDRLQQQQTPRRHKAVRIVESSRLAQAAATYLDRLDRLRCQTERMRASWYRDGLILLLLAHRPIRLRNLTTIEIDRHLERRKGIYHLAFDAAETKDKLPLTFPCPTGLTPYMDHYLEHRRPILMRDVPSKRLWLTMRSGPASMQTIYIAVCKLTDQLLGHPINPHLFRDCLVSQMAELAPESLLAASRILGHASLTTTNRHYNQAQMLKASKAHQKVLEEYFAELQEAS